TRAAVARCAAHAEERAPRVCGWGADDVGCERTEQGASRRAVGAAVARLARGDDAVAAAGDRAVRVAAVAVVEVAVVAGLAAPDVAQQGGDTDVAERRRRGEIQAAGAECAVVFGHAGDPGAPGRAALVDAASA